MQPAWPVRDSEWWIRKGRLSSHGLRRRSTPVLAADLSRPRRRRGAVAVPNTTSTTLLRLGCDSRDEDLIVIIVAVADVSIGSVGGGIIRRRSDRRGTPCHAILI